MLGKELSDESGLSIQDYAVLVAPERSARWGDAGVRARSRARLGEEQAVASHNSYGRKRSGRPPGCKTDKRGAFIEITESGRKAIRSAAPGHVASVRRYFIDQLTPRELEALTKIAGKVQTALSSTGACDS